MFDALRERTKELYRAKDKAAPSEDAVQDIKSKTQDWYAGLPGKGDPNRENKKKLL